MLLIVCNDPVLKSLRPTRHSRSMWKRRPIAQPAAGACLAKILFDYPLLERLLKLWDRVVWETLALISDRRDHPARETSRVSRAGQAT